MMTMVRISKATAIIWIVVSSSNCLYFKAAQALLPIFPVTTTIAHHGTPTVTLASKTNIVPSASLRIADAVHKQSRYHHRQHSYEWYDTMAQSLWNNDNKRRRLLHGLTMYLVAGGSLVTTSPTARAFNDDDNDDNSLPPPIIAVTMCEKAVSSGAPPNCISTASVRQVDLYAAPWTWYDETVSAEAILARLKGVIVVDPNLTLIAQTPDGLIVTAQRNAFCTDQIIFRINANDRAVTFVSRQVQGPDGISDFGANRKRLEQIRLATGMLQVMGSELDNADSTGRREGVKDQLKAFWGLQSGGGYESVLLDQEE